MLYYIRRVALERGLTVVLCGTAKNPADVSPPAAVPRRVRIALLVRVRVMNPMCGYPLNWPTFQSQRAARHQKVFHDPGHVITAVSKQSMEPHTDPQTAGDPVENYCADERGPTPKEQRRNSSNMTYDQKNSGAPADSLVLCCRATDYSFSHSFPFVFDRCYHAYDAERRGRNDRIELRGDDK